jgi:hypothetical protein
MPEVDQQRVEELGPAERIINSITQYTDHMIHNRPGIVYQDGRQLGGARWQQATWIKEGDEKVVYAVTKNGRRRQQKTRVGVGVPGTTDVRENGTVVCRFQPPGVFPEVVGHLYKQIAEIWKMDNEFAAKWASWAFTKEENRDLKVLLAAFMLVQSRFGEPIKDGDETFLDDDYRAVGEAMCLLRRRKAGFNPKLLLRIGEVLETPQVIEINREMGFGRTNRRAIVGRYYKVIEKWLRNCEQNIKVLETLVKNGFRTSVMKLARKVGYKPESKKFFEILRWKQVQSKDGHREIAVGEEVKAAETWEGLNEQQICEKIVSGRKASWKVISGMLPSDVGVTPAIMAAAVEKGCLSDQDLIIMTPTLEELDLLKDPVVERKWKAAIEKAENQRAENIAKNVRSQKAKEGLEKAVDTAAAKAVEEVVRDLRVYVMVDKSGSMQNAIDQAKEYLARFVGAFPLDKLHVCVFNTVGREVTINSPTRAAVAQAFRGHSAGGGTSYACAVSCLTNKYKPAENEDALFIFVGDEQDHNVRNLVNIIQRSGVIPVAFGMLHVSGIAYGGYRNGQIVHLAANELGIPCFDIDEKIFADPYAVPRTIRNLIAATPVGQAAARAPKPRVNLVEQILNTPLLQKPAWA